MLLFKRRTSLPVKRISQADIEANFDRLQKSLDEVHQAHRETEKTLNKAIGDLSNTLGSLVEHIMTPALSRKFEQFGFTFDGVVMVKWKRGTGSIYTEIDGLLENEKQAMAVEVKTTLRRKDVDEHLERMKRIRIYADKNGDRRTFFGAMAGAIIDEDTKRYALSQGFFVIEPSGEDVTVTQPSIEPKKWPQSGGVSYP